MRVSYAVQRSSVSIVTARRYFSPGIQLETIGRVICTVDILLSSRCFDVKVRHVNIKVISYTNGTEPRSCINL
jgi:hypothetical protein